MSGLTSDPSADSNEPTPDSAPWIDTEEAPLYPEPSAAQSASAAGSSTDQLPTIGHIGRYALKYQIGEGGLGRVYAAHDPLLSRLIAIKTLNLEIAAEERESFNTLFLNEARAAGGLSHPHIVTVFDAGLSEQGAYIAMELLKGRDLRQLRLEGWKPTPTQAALIVRRVSDALAYAHSKGVVHRDIKPANIFMVGRTQPRVLDFGIARVAHHHEADGDIAGGSPYYMAPEQVRHQAVDRRCDVFSLGVVLYELLTGTRPFRGASLKEITDAVVEYQPPRAHEVDVGVPKALSDIACRAMEKNPEDRYRSARALSRELRHWLEEHAQENESVEEAPPLAKGRTGLAFAAILVGALAIAGAWWFFAPHGESQILAKAPPAPAASAVPASAPQAQTALAVAAAASAAAAAPLVAEAASAAASVAAPASAVQVAVAASAQPALVAAASAAEIIPRPAPVMAAPADAVALPGPTLVVKAVQPTAPKETAKQRRAREVREREAKLTASTPVQTPLGVVHLAVTPWGQIEVDGKPAGTAPPLSELTLPEGRHTITIRNDEFPPFNSNVTVVPGQPVTLKHRFGS